MGKIKSGRKFSGKGGMYAHKGQDHDHVHVCTVVKCGKGEGAVEVTLGDGRRFSLGALDQFVVPPRTRYTIKNKGDKDCIIFVNIVW